MYQLTLSDELSETIQHPGSPEELSVHAEHGPVSFVDERPRIFVDARLRGLLFLSGDEIAEPFLSRPSLSFVLVCIGVAGGIAPWVIVIINRSRRKRGRMEIDWQY